MSVQGQIDRISSNIASTYRIAQREGITLPENRNSDNLPTLINSFINGNAPDYIIDEAERVATNVQSTQSDDSLVFPILSDFHAYDGNSSSNHLDTYTSMRYASMGIAELKKRIDLDFVGYLGDYSWMSSDSYLAEQVIDDITSVRDTFDSHNTEVWCVGNHDLNYGKGRDRLLTLDELYSYIGANSDGIKPDENANRCYGYLDFEQQKIRVIYLNTCDASDLVVPELGTEHASSEWVSPTQIQWLADTALNFSDKDKASDWGIVIVGHHPLHYPIGCFKSVMTLLEAYRDGLKGSLSCTIRTDTVTNEDGSVSKQYPQQKVTYDFSSVEKAEIICNIHGHAHNYASSKISSTTSSGSTTVAPWLWRFCIPQICSTRNNTGYENFKTNETAAKNYGEFESDGVTPKYWVKETGNAKVTSFCVVDINRSKKKVFAYYFGIGKDREFSYDTEYVAQEFNINVSVNNCSGNSNNPTVITEGETATLLFTANTGYELPDSVSVTGATHSWDKTSGTLVLSIPTEDVSVSVIAVAIPVENFTITRNLTNCSSDSSATTVNATDTVSETITADENYNISNIIVSMGGVDKTYSVVNGDTINITNVSDDIVITAKAVDNYTNQMRISTDTDGSIYNGVGYKLDTSIRDSDNNEEDGTITNRAGIVTTGFIPIPDIMAGTAADYVLGKIVLHFAKTKLDKTANTLVAFYEEQSLDSFIGLRYGVHCVTESTTSVAETFIEIDDNGYITSMDLSKLINYYKLSSAYKKTANYIRISGVGIDSNSIITVNEPINGLGDDEQYTNINQIPISTDTDGSIYNGCGYKEGLKFSTDNSKLGDEQSASGVVATGFIPFGYGSSNSARGEQVIYLKDIEALATNSNVRIALYTADKTCLSVRVATQFLPATDYSSSTSTGVFYTADSNGYITSIDFTGYTSYLHNEGVNNSADKDVAFFRFCSPGIDDDSIIKVNEPFVTHSITNNLTGVTTSNACTSVYHKESYSAELTVAEGYELSSIVVTMGGTDITSSVVNGTIINIAEVTGDIVITAVAEVVEVTPSYTNLLPLATTSPTDNTIYGEDYDGDGANDGYKKDTRFSSSSGIQTKAGYQLTGLILATNDDIVRIKNIGGEITTANKNLEFYIFVKNDGTLSAQQPANNYATGYEQPDANGVYTFKAPLSANACCGIRFSGKGITGDTIITVNEEII
jgi:hypothetical protein